VPESPFPNPNPATSKTNPKPDPTNRILLTLTLFECFARNFYLVHTLCHQKNVIHFAGLRTRVSMTEA